MKIELGVALPNKSAPSIETISLAFPCPLHLEYCTTLKGGRQKILVKVLVRGGGVRES